MIIEKTLRVRYFGMNWIRSTTFDLWNKKN